MKTGKNIAIFAGVAAILIAAGLVWATLAKEPSVTNTKSLHGSLVQTTGSLHGHIKQLRNEVDNFPHDPQAAYKTYMQTLASIEQDCAKIQKTAKMASAVRISESEREQITQTTNLCDDLTPLVQYTKGRYEAAAPFLNYSTKMRVGEKLSSWFVKRRIQSVSAASTTAQNRLEGLAVNDKYDFNTTSNLMADAKTVVQEAEKASATKSGLQVLLNTMRQQQQSSLSGRAQLWNSSVSIESLQAVTASQLANYCGWKYADTKPEACG